MALIKTFLVVDQVIDQKTKTNLLALELALFYKKLNYHRALEISLKIDNSSRSFLIFGVERVHNQRGI